MGVSCLKAHVERFLSVLKAPLRLRTSFFVKAPFDGFLSFFKATFKGFLFCLTAPI